MDLQWFLFISQSNLMQNNKIESVKKQIEATNQLIYKIVGKPQTA